METFYFDFSKKGKDVLGNMDVPILTNEQAVKESVFNILMTEIETKLYDPEYGCNLDRFLFEPIDELTASLIQTSIETAIQKFEKRVTDLNVYVEPIYDDNTFNITIEFTVVFSSNSQTIQVNFNKIR